MCAAGTSTPCPTCLLLSLDNFLFLHWWEAHQAQGHLLQGSDGFAHFCIHPQISAFSMNVIALGVTSSKHLARPKILVVHIRAISFVAWIGR